MSVKDFISVLRDKDTRHSLFTIIGRTLIALVKLFIICLALIELTKPFMIMYLHYLYIGSWM